MKKPAPRVKLDAGHGRSRSRYCLNTQGPCVKAARFTQKPRLDAVTGGDAACGRLTTAHSVERLLWDSTKPSPVRKLRGRWTGMRISSQVGSKVRRPHRPYRPNAMDWLQSAGGQRDTLAFAAEDVVLRPFAPNFTSQHEG